MYVSLTVLYKRKYFFALLPAEHLQNHQKSYCQCVGANKECNVLKSVSKFNDLKFMFAKNGVCVTIVINRVP